MISASLRSKWARELDERLSISPLDLPIDLLPPVAENVHRSCAAAMMLEIAIERRGHGFRADSKWLKRQIADPTLGIQTQDAVKLLQGLFTSEVERRRKTSWSDFQGFGFSNEELQLAAENDRLSLGQELWDGMVLQDRVAEGGVAVVYRAETADHSPIAIKIPKKLEGASDDPYAQAIRQEAKVLSQLGFAGIPKLLECREWNSIPILAMEWIESPHGAGFPERSTRDEKLCYLAQLSRIIDQLHRRDLIHGDIKPYNFMVDQGQQVWLLDFNITRTAFPEHNSDGPLPGTHVMMSPEALVGVSADADVSQDIHALGAMTYEAITGRPPHQQGGREVALVASILAGGKHELEFPEGAPETLKAICRVAISRHVHQRFATAEDFAATLERYLSGNLVLEDIPPRRLHIVAWRLGDALGRCLTRTRRVIETLNSENHEPRTRLTKKEIAALGDAMGMALAVEEIVMLDSRIGWRLPPPPKEEILSTAFYRARKLTADDLLPVRQCAEEFEAWFRATWHYIQTEIAQAFPSLFLLTAASLQARFSEGSKTARQTWNKLAAHAELPAEAIARFDRALLEGLKDVAWEQAVRRLDYDVMKWLRWQHS